MKAILSPRRSRAKEFVGCQTDFRKDQEATRVPAWVNIRQNDNDLSQKFYSSLPEGRLTKSIRSRYVPDDDTDLALCVLTDQDDREHLATSFNAFSALSR